MDKYIEFKFSATYSLADYIREIVFRNDKDDYLHDFFDVTDEEFRKQLLNPSKQTILHDFIIGKYDEGAEYFNRKMDHDSVIEEWTKLLNDYKVKIKTAEELAEENGYEDEYDIKSTYADYLEEQIFAHVSCRVADETFQLLFSDRMFCLKFNSLISEITSSLKLKDYPDLLEKNGKLKRCSYFPEWVQRAVYLRDKGRCAVCLTDLTGLLVTDYHDAIDHIIPLNMGGSNDITNLQLICRTCNLDKSGHTIRTSELYPKYF